MTGTGQSRAFEISVDGGAVSGLRAGPVDDHAGLPVVVAIHGGTYTSGYFDVDGHSLLTRAAAQGFCVVAIDRPGYGATTALPKAPDLIQKNAEWLAQTLPGILGGLGLGGRPVFLLGHSIGGAIVISTAALERDWELYGIAVSGVGFRTPPESAEAYAHLPDTYFVELPAPMKDQVMFGPPQTHPASMPAASHIANTHVPRAELTDIVAGWQQRLPSQAPQVAVPMHYRQGGHERLWLTGDEMIEGFTRLFTATPRLDVEVLGDAGHCIDFHNCGGAFQDSQLAFARQTAGKTAP